MTRARQPTSVQDLPTTVPSMTKLEHITRGIDGQSVQLRYARRPFTREPDFGATSVNYELSAPLALSEEPA